MASDCDANKMRLLVHSAKQVVAITNQDVTSLSGRSMKSVEVLENSSDGVAVAVDE
jgi:hypothetical protein